MQATPPFYSPPSEETDATDQDDKEAWAGHEQDGLTETVPGTTPPRDRPCPDEPPPAGKKTAADVIEWETVAPAVMVSCRSRSAAENRTVALPQRCVAIAQLCEILCGWLVCVWVYTVNTLGATQLIKHSWSTCWSALGLQILMHNDDCALLRAPF